MMLIARRGAESLRESGLETKDIDLDPNDSFRTIGGSSIAGLTRRSA